MEQTHTRKSWLDVIAANFAWWIVPVVVWYFHRHDYSLGPLVLIFAITLAVLLGVCTQFRQARWTVMVWMPVLAWSCIGTLIVIKVVASEAVAGATEAPLGGAVIIVGIVLAVGLGFITILSLIWRPRIYSLPLLVLAVANTAAVSLATRQVSRFATSQEIMVHIVDPTGKPVSGAAARYTRYGYGPGGKKEFDGQGGPILSREDGIAIIPSRHMRYKTIGTISKPGFRDVRFTLEMQYGKSDTDREVTISTAETDNIARGRIPTAEPVTFSIYLPPESDAPDRGQPIRRMEVESRIASQGSNVANILNIQTGIFTNHPAGDLRFDPFLEIEDGKYERLRLRVTGLNGTKVLQVPQELSFSGALSPYEHVFRIAPESGYQAEIIIQRPGDSPSATIYVSARDRRIYARMEVEAWGSNPANVRCRVRLFLNTTGGRQLE